MGQHTQSCCSAPPPPPGCCNGNPPVCLAVTIGGITSFPGCGKCTECEQANTTYHLRQAAGMCAWTASYCGTPHTRSHCGFAELSVEVIDNGDGTFTIRGILIGEETIVFETHSPWMPDCSRWENLALIRVSGGSSHPNDFFHCNTGSATFSITAIQEPACTSTSQPCADETPDVPSPDCPLCDPEYPMSMPTSWLVIIPNDWTWTGKCQQADCAVPVGAFVLDVEVVGLIKAPCSYVIRIGAGQCCDWHVITCRVQSAGARIYLQILINQGACFVGPGFTVLSWEVDLPATPCGPAKIDCSFPDAPYTVPYIGSTSPNNEICHWGGAALTANPIWS